MLNAVYIVKRYTLLASCLCFLALTGCSTAPVPVNYAPSSVKSASGQLSVADFTYFPSSAAAVDPVAENQIRNTAMGEIKIDRDVKKFVRDAVFAEFRFVGIKTDDTSKVLKGDIEEFLIDDLGYSIDWTLRIRYTLEDAQSKQIMFTGAKNTKRRTAKFANSFGALNETIKINVEQLLDDPDFIKSIQ